MTRIPRRSEPATIDQQIDAVARAAQTLLDATDQLATAAACIGIMIDRTRLYRMAGECQSLSRQANAIQHRLLDIRDADDAALDAKVERLSGGTAVPMGCAD